jgi:hypothetical protein
VRSLEGRLSVTYIDVAENKQARRVTPVDPFLRAELERAYAIDDAARADYERSSKHTVQKRSGDLGLVYKTHEQKPMQQQQADWSGWDRWVKAHIEIALHDFLKNILEPGIGEALGETRIDMREDFERQLGELRAEIEILRSVIKSQNVGIITRSKDVA